MSQGNRPPWLKPLAAEGAAEPVGERTVVGIDATRATTPEAPPSAPPPEIQATLLVRKAGSVGNLNLSNDNVTFSIGNSREESEIHLNDPIISKRQLVIVRIGREFVMVDCGVKDLVRFDGIMARQVVIPVNVRCIITMGSSVLVFNSKELPASPPGLPTGLMARSGHFVPDSQLPEGGATIDVGGQICTTTRAPVVIGGYEGCDIVVPARGQEVQPYMAMFFWTHEGLFVKAMALDAVTVGGRPVEDVVYVDTEEKIEILGTPVKIERQGNWRDRCAQMLPEADFKFASFGFTSLNPSAVKSFTVPAEGNPLTLGRSATCDIFMDETSVSRVHAQVIPSGKSFYLIDNYSSNGTYVNDVRITKRRIRAGDIVEFGRNAFVVHYA